GTRFLMNTYALDLPPSADLFGKIAYNTLEHDVFARDFKSAWKLTQKALDHRFRLHADHRIERPAHPEIRNVCRSTGKNSLIGCLDVRMGAVDNRSSAVEKPAHSILFRGRFRMYVHDHHRRIMTMFSQDQTYGTERIIHVVRHKNASLHINNQGLQTVLAPPLTPAPSRRTRRIIRRTKEIGLLIQKRIDLFFLPNVIARGKDVNTGREEFSSALDVYPHSPSRVLCIRDHEIDPVIFNHSRHEISDGPACRPAHDIAQN